MTKPLIIFGGSGFIGQALCQEAVKQNIPVVSISKHGKPKKNDLWVTNPLITWVAADIFKETKWKSYLENAFGCVNLIGILFEDKKRGLTYEKMIVRSNYLISRVAEKNNCPYLFLSAKGGPKKYVQAKKDAEKILHHKTNPTIIIRSGIVVTKKSPLRYSQGVAIKIASYLPLVHRFANKVYPTPLDTLVHTILNEMKDPSHKIIEDIR